jgi:hypothetical protein
MRVCARRWIERLRGGRVIAGVGFFGKLLCVISCFRHQDAQTPPSPTRGEGGWGDERQRHARMQRISHLS